MGHGDQQRFRPLFHRRGGGEGGEEEKRGGPSTLEAGGRETGERGRHSERARNWGQGREGSAGIVAPPCCQSVQVAGIVLHRSAAPACARPVGTQERLSQSESDSGDCF